jgi:hypothetical protein
MASTDRQTAQIEFLIIDEADFNEDTNVWTIDADQIDAVVTELSEANPDMDVLAILAIVEGVIDGMGNVVRI